MLPQDLPRVTWLQAGLGLLRFRRLPPNGGAVGYLSQGNVVVTDPDLRRQALIMANNRGLGYAGPSWGPEGLPTPFNPEELGTTTHWPAGIVGNHRRCNVVSHGKNETRCHQVEPCCNQMRRALGPNTQTMNSN